MYMQQGVARDENECKLAAQTEVAHVTQHVLHGDLCRGCAPPGGAEHWLRQIKSSNPQSCASKWHCQLACPAGQLQNIARRLPGKFRVVGEVCTYGEERVIEGGMVVEIRIQGR